MGEREALTSDSDRHQAGLGGADDLSSGWPARPAATRSSVENGEAQADDLGFCSEPPDGIEPSTYAYRTSRDAACY
ncbi:hypothetical protein [Micromonospora phaseoli]|uniref:hypothetical protein n=1 Tax=Micromonospora phaseoli TaxID=1144548 RepID=UPI0011146487|nr:hypothetical protein [Micromonospora phaseoli]